MTSCLCAFPYVPQVVAYPVTFCCCWWYFLTDVLNACIYLTYFYCVLLFTARRYASAVLGVVILSVCPSVRPSVRLSVCLSVHLSHACFVTNPKNLLAIFYTTWKGNPSSFLPCNSSWWATSPSTLNGRSKWPTPFKNGSCRQISACNVSTVRASEKVQLWRIGSRTQAFLRAIDEVRMLPPKGWLKKRTFSFFGIKVNFSWMKSATKFLWEKTSSGKVVVHSFPYLTVHRYWGKH